jgi:hypothetical protein
VGGYDRNLKELFENELHNSASEPNIVRIINSERLKQARHAVCLRELTHAGTQTHIHKRSFS